jgi:hypothetical protein
LILAVDFFHPAFDIAHLIQVALTPIFLISAIGVTLNVLTSRLARIVDRARTLEDRLMLGQQPPSAHDVHRQLAVLEGRAGYINTAITCIILSALFIALVVVMLFVNAAALLAFLIEVRIATKTLRIGIEEASRQS